MPTQSNTYNYGWHNTESDYLVDVLEPSISILMKSLSSKRILDLGCGNGKLCSILATDSSYDVVGIDPDKKGIEIAKEAYPDIPFYQMGVEDDPAVLQASEAEAFDTVVSTEVVEHLYSPQQLPQFASKVLKDKGNLIVTTPYHGFLKNLLLILSGRFDSHFDPLWEGGHIKFWSKSTLVKLMEENGFKLRCFQGVGRCPYLWKSMVVVFEKQ